MISNKRLLLIACLALLAGAAGGQTTLAQQVPPDQAIASAPAPEVGLSQAELQRLAAEAARSQTTAADGQTQRGQIDFLSLLLQGGAMMIPIALMSLLVVAVSLERLFALRGGALLPRGLRRELARAGKLPPMQVPAALAVAADKYRSVAGRMLGEMLQKVGRPLPEIEATIAESAQHEADTMYNNVRWLNLAAAVTPLIGLLGTVWGMIIAFYNTTQLGAGTNKAEFLAEGIYVALVTTLGGLAVAIPAAICAHYFEGRITTTVAAIEKELKRLIPKFEPLEGRLRWDPETQRLQTSGSNSPGTDVDVAHSRSRAVVG
ncbi:MAG: MotA/TolQ/ExbB proton channel family protein [Planctomycetota bacterium]|nr:MAG: MotA/TolQ/ExbB proton channel family protein [Planctomycetota bacterium]